MKYYLNLDAEGYLLSVSKTNTGGPAVDTLEGLDLSGCRIGAHRFDGTQLILDEERLAQLKAEEEATARPDEPVEAVSWNTMAEAIREGVDSV